MAVRDLRPTLTSNPRLDVRKTYKLVVNGAFVRSESGRSYEIVDASGTFVANVARASRKDVRDAVVAARAAQAKWWAATAYNRGQVLYRLAEMAESRRDELRDHVALAEASEAVAAVARAIDRVVWYAGWTDKIAQVYGSTNPVAGPFFNFSHPTPSGVVAVLAHPTSFEGLIDQVMAPLAAGNTVVVVASERHPTPAVLLGELSVTADFPPGVLNVLTGSLDELAPVVCAHEDVDGVDLSGVDDALLGELRSLSAESIKRVVRAGFASDADSLRRLRTFIETTTVWHTVGQ
ncbi:MAG: aldehyde dehydrogenase family protein [Acidobacteriota bacterium]|nr:aldehyde dehydrogenase family protein [Acidobacteriota bacterium]